VSRISILLILLCGFVTGPYSHAISRVGNGYVIDEISEFVAELPKTIIESRSLPDNGIVLYLNPGLGDLLQTHEFQMNGPKVLEINTFSAKYPDLVSLSKENIRERLLQGPLSWTELAASDCALAFSVTTQTAVNMVILWGNGKGIVLVGPRSSSVQNAVLQIWQTLSLKPGACAWN